MKKWICIFIAAALLAGCHKRVEAPAAATAPQSPAVELIEETQPAAPQITIGDLVGPWYLDTAKNDMDGLRVLFGSSMASGTGMEIRSNGQMSFSIGAAAGGAGSCTLEGGSLQAQLVSFAESRAEDYTFAIMQEEDTILLAQDIFDTTVYWTQKEPEIASSTDVGQYSTVLDLYNKAMHEHWSVEKCRDNDVNYLIAIIDDAAMVGWEVRDVDSDGSPELLIGDVGGPNIYALYTMAQGTPKQVIDAGERSAWYLEPDGILVNDGSSSAFLHCWLFYWLKNGALELNNGILSDYQANEAEPYYLTTDLDDSRDNDTKLSTAKAEELITAYQTNYVTPNYSPFSSYAAG